MTLEQSRKKIDQIDKKIINLLALRYDVVKKIGIYKKLHKLPILDATRWTKILSSLEEIGKKKWLSKKFITDLRKRIHKESLQLQRITKKPA